ncbi:MAG: hypothetical protein ACOCT9_00125 [archaeon]
MGKYKVPLEKRKEREQIIKFLNNLCFSLVLYLTVGFIATFITAGAVAYFIAAGSGVGQALMGTGFLVGIISAWLAHMLVEHKQATKN